MVQFTSSNSRKRERGSFLKSAKTALERGKVNEIPGEGKHNLLSKVSIKCPYLAIK